jgi:TP901 family phage tail tape measure protein
MGQALNLDVYLSATNRASGPLQQIERASQGTSNELKEARDQLKRLQNQQRDITSFKELYKATGNNSEALKKAVQQSKQLRREFKATSEPTEKLALDVERAADSVARLRRLQKKHARDLENTRTRLQTAGISTRNLSNEQRNLTRRIEESDRALEGHQNQLNRTRIRQERLNAARRRMQRTQSAAGNITGAGAGATATGSAAMLAVAKTASVGMNFDASMSKVQAITRLDTESEDLKALRKQARNLGATTMFSAGEAAGGQSFLAMAGFTPDAIQNAMPGILSTAAAAGVDIASAADIGSNILSGFNLDSSEMGRVGDVLTSAFTRGNVDLMSLGETMKYVAPVASDLGVSIEQTAAMAAKLGDNGIKSSMAGTGMKAIFSRLAAGPKMAKKALSGLGVSAVNDAGKMRPMVDILKDIGKATEGLDDDKRLEALKGIAGLEAVSSLSVLVKEAKSGKLQKLIEEILNDKGASQKVASVMADNASGDLKELLSSIQDVAIEITSLNGGPLRDIIQSATRITRNIGDWIRANPELAATLAKIAAVTSAVLLGFGALALIVGALLGPFALLRFSLASVGIRGIGLTRVFNKIGGEGTFLRKILSSLRSKLLVVGSALKLKAAAAGRKLLSGLAKGALYLGKTVLPMVGRAIVVLGRALLLNPIGLAVTAIAGGAYLIYKNWEGISTWFSAKWAAAKIVFNEFKIYLGTWWESVGGTFTGALLNIGTTLINWSPFGLLYDVIAQALAQLGVELPKKFSQFGGMLIDGLTQGIKNKASALKSSITGVGDDISGWFKETLNINSPSKVFVKHGGSVIEGLEKGLSDNKRTLTPITDISNRLKKAGAGLTLAASLPVAANTLTPPVLDTRPPLSAAASSQNSAPSLIIENLVINAAPGMDEHMLAQLVAREIERHQRQAISSQRSNLSDRD